MILQGPKAFKFTFRQPQSSFDLPLLCLDNIPLSFWTKSVEAAENAGYLKTMMHRFRTPFKYKQFQMKVGFPATQ